MEQIEKLRIDIFSIWKEVRLMAEATKEQLEKAHDAAVRDKESGGKSVPPHKTSLFSQDLNRKTEINKEYERAFKSAEVKNKE